MLRAASSCPAQSSTTSGLAALVRLINDELLARGTRLAGLFPALAGPASSSAWGGPLVAHTAVETPSPTPGRTTRLPGRAGRVLHSAPSASGSAGSTLPDGGIDDEHVEIWQLVARAQGGDGEAFGLLYDRYVDSVFRFIYYRVNDRALAEDFTSETFVRALRRISTITYQGRDIGAWFMTIARNIVLDHVKSARHRLESTTGDTIEPGEHAQSTESAVLDSLDAERLRAAVDRLGPEQRECVTLRFMQGLSVSETAAVMGKNDGAIKALQHRAIRKLAEILGDDLR
jgi:RNA polymerase sigma-70 factor (ECF subfamily)